jgi:hypothetical protein
MPCCDCCCPDGEECCKAPGPDGICCDPERCCGTEEDPVCCSELDPIQFCCGEVCCNEGDTCCGEGSEASCCPEDEYCCDGECQEEPCEEPECSEETLSEPCGEEEPLDPDTGVGYICCWTNNNVIACSGFPVQVYGCEEEEYCIGSGEPGTWTRLGPYDSSFERDTAVTAWCNDNCPDCSSNPVSCDGGVSAFSFVFCPDDPP